MKRIRRSYATLDRNSDKDETPRHEACEKRRREKIDEDESTSAAKALGSQRGNSAEGCSGVGCHEGRDSHASAEG